MKRVLLNITRSELMRFSGDISYYRNLLEAKIPDIEFSIVNPKSPRTVVLREARKIIDRMMDARFPSELNRLLLYGSRYLYIPRQALDNVDAILSHIIFPFMPNVRNRPRIIWSSQGISPPFYYNYHGSATFDQVVDMYNRFAAKCDGVLIWTNSCADIVRRHCSFSTPIYVLPPIINPPIKSERSLPREADIHLLFIGRDPQRKGLYDVLKAYSKLAGTDGRVIFDVVSRVPATVQDEYKVNKGVRFYSGLANEEINAFLDRADILILPTYAETYGFVLIEAMARGCAIITSDYVPLNELVEDGKNGLLVKPGDIEGIAVALESLMRNPNLIKQFSENNKRKYWESFSPDKLALEYRKVLIS